MAFFNKEVLFNDGEGLSSDDLNDAQRYLKSFVSDMVLAPLLRKTDLGALIGSRLTGYAIGHSAAPYDSGTNLTITNERGPLFQILETETTGLDGDDANLLCYYFDAGELETTLSTGVGLGGGNSRWDVIEVRLSYEDADAADQESRDIKDAVSGALSVNPSLVKKRKVKFEKQVLEGTPAATASAALPTKTAGWFRLCAVRVDDGVSGTINPLYIRDFRVPLGVNREFHHAANGQYDAADINAVGLPGIVETSSSATRPHMFTPTQRASSARLTQVRYGCNPLSTSTIAVSLKRYDHADSDLTTLKFSESDTSLPDMANDSLDLDLTSSLIPNIPVVPASGDLYLNEYSLIEDLPDQPIWSNGHGNGYAIDRFGSRIGYGGSEHMEQVALVTDMSGTTQDEIRCAEFIWAGG